MSKLILSNETKSALDAGFAAAFGGSPERYFSGLFYAPQVGLEPTTLRLTGDGLYIL